MAKYVQFVFKALEDDLTDILQQELGTWIYLRAYCYNNYHI